MTSKSIKHCTLLGGLLGAASLVAAEVPPATPEQLRAASQIVYPFMNILDCENVGYVQRGEVDEHFFPILNTFDRDGSRSISRRELLAYPYLEDKDLLAVSFGVMDVDGNDHVSPLELRDYLNIVIEQLDGNGDGDVYPEELARAGSDGDEPRPAHKSPAPSTARTRPVDPLAPVKSSSPTSPAFD